MNRINSKLKILNLKILANNFAQNLEILRYFEFREITLLKKKIRIKNNKKINMPPKTPGKNTPKAKKPEISRKKKRVESFSVYIYRVLKQVHPETGISKRSMSIMNSFIHDIFEKIATESSKLVRYNKKQTLSSREV